MQYGCCRQSLQISQSKINRGWSITCKADFVPPCSSDRDAGKQGRVTSPYAETTGEDSLKEWD